MWAPPHREVTALLTYQCSGSTQVNPVQKVTEMCLCTFNFHHYKRTYQTEVNHSVWDVIITHCVAWLETVLSPPLVLVSNYMTFNPMICSLYDNESCNCLPFKQPDLIFLWVEVQARSYEVRVGLRCMTCSDLRLLTLLMAAASHSKQLITACYLCFLRPLPTYCSLSVDWAFEHILYSVILPSRYCIKMFSFSMCCLQL